MGPTIRLSVVTSAASLLLATAVADAATRPIRGKLDRPGYTVLALTGGGEARALGVSRKRFSITPPASGVTLHLRAPNGVYAGPVVVGRARRGSRAILGIKDGARLGTVDIRTGYAKVVKRLGSRKVDASFRSRARRGVPIGARRFGRVASSIPRASVPGDHDFDGIPDVLDIDDDGDLVLDNQDRSLGGARSAQAASERFDVNVELPLQLETTANANAAAIDRQDVDAALSSAGLLNIEIFPGTPPELDCAGANQDPPTGQGLAYCSPGGTGIARADRALFPEFWNGSDPYARAPFPGCCDADRDGFGTLQQVPGAPPGGMGLEHHATTAGIGTGDVLIARTEAGAYPAALPFVFATVPALVAYRDGASPVNSATPVYPVSPGGLGTQDNGFPVDVGCNGVAVACDPATDVVLTLTFWRPQRERIPADPQPGPGESGEWTDIGGLAHSAVIQRIGALGDPTATTVQQPCPASSYSTTDPGFGQPPRHITGGFLDLATDRPADPQNTLTYTLNVTQCLTSLGASWGAGEPANVVFGTAVAKPGGGAGASQGVWFERSR